uniref:Uncharacterized protein n=1 Tax=Anopheles merus TaxID=30066 RepID=A0A182USD9_ANOME
MLVIAAFERFRPLVNEARRQPLQLHALRRDDVAVIDQSHPDLRIRFHHLRPVVIVRIETDGVRVANAHHRRSTARLTVHDQIVHHSIKHSHIVQPVDVELRARFDVAYDHVIASATLKTTKRRIPVHLLATKLLQPVEQYDTNAAPSGGVTLSDSTFPATSREKIPATSAFTSSSRRTFESANRVENIS